VEADELRAAPLNDLPQPLEVPVRPGQPIELPADHAGEQAGAQVVKKPLELRPAHLLNADRSTSS